MITKELSLTKSFLKVFQESNIKNLEDKPAILQAQYHPFLKNNFLIRTNNNIVLYDFLKNQLDLIYHGPTSPFFIGNNNLYFLEQNGALVLYSLQEQKIYYHHTGYIGHLKEKKLKDLWEENPAETFKSIVRPMLPKNKLRDRRLKKLIINL